MREHLLPALRTTLVLLVLTCGVYPATVWAIGQLAFREQANGSLIVRDGRVIGSSLIAQGFTSDRYFHPRPSAVNYDATASGGSNLGPTSKKLRERGGTTSASGLDPHITPEDALAQTARVARARGLDASFVRTLVAQHIEGRFLGVYGDPRVNVLLLNLDLDAQRVPTPRSR